MTMLPMGCLKSRQAAFRVACFGCAETGRESWQHFEESRINIGVLRLPRDATLPRQATHGCQPGCLAGDWMEAA